MLTLIAWIALARLFGSLAPLHSAAVCWRSSCQEQSHALPQTMCANWMMTFLVLNEVISIRKILL
jgi:hypothetical protein